MPLCGWGGERNEKNIKHTAHVRLNGRNDLRFCMVGNGSDNK